MGAEPLWALRGFHVRSVRRSQVLHYDAVTIDPKHDMVTGHHRILHIQVALFGTPDSELTHTVLGFKVVFDVSPAKLNPDSHAPPFP